MQNLFSKPKTCFHGFHRHLPFSTAISTSSPTDCVASYLVDSLGFSHTQALSTSAKLAPRKKEVNDFKFDANANSVVNFFKFHGFDDTHIRKIVSFHPRLLCSSAQKTFEPKIKMFKDMGFSGSDIISVVTKNPQILLLGLESNILPTIGNLREVLGCDGDVIAFIKRLKGWSFNMITSCMLPNIAALSSYGVPMELIRKYLLLNARVFVRNPEAFKDILVRVEQKLGIPRNSPMFVYGIQVAAMSKENIQSKCQMLKSFGWTESDIKTFVMKNPSCFSLSEASFKKKLEFLMNELQLEPAYLTSHNALLTCSLEKRIVPRHKVLLILKEKRLLEKNTSLYTAVHVSEPVFLKRFVIPFKEVHEVYAKHTGCSMKMLIQERAAAFSKLATYGSSADECFKDDVEVPCLDIVVARDIQAEILSIYKGC